MARKNRAAADWKRVSLIVLCVILSLILVALIFATTYVNYLFGLLGDLNEDPSESTSTSQSTVDPTENSTGTQDTLDTIPPDTETLDPTFTGDTKDPTDVTIETVPDVEPIGNRDGIVNILLVGQDRREGQGRQRSDTMILCTFNTNKKTLTLTSFLRDTYVYIPGYGNNKLNAAYAKGGFNLLNETLAVNYGVHVDGNVEVDFDGFIGIIDLMGGVDIKLTAKEAAYMNEHKGFEFNKNEVWNLKEGMNHLNADQALAYARIRKLDSDFGRTARQRTVLMALLNKYKSQSVTTMLGMLDDILPMISTNMTKKEIVSYVVNLFPMLVNSSLSTQHIPAYGTYTSERINGIGDSLVPDLAKNRKILAEILYN